MGGYFLQLAGRVGMRAGVLPEQFETSEKPEFPGRFRWVGCEYRPAAGTEAGLGWARPWGIRPSRA